MTFCFGARHLREIAACSATPSDRTEAPKEALLHPSVAYNSSLLLKRGIAFGPRVKGCPRARQRESRGFAVRALTRPRPRGVLLECKPHIEGRGRESVARREMDDARAETEVERGSSPTRSAQEVLRRMSLNSPPSRADNPRQIKRAKVGTLLWKRLAILSWSVLTGCLMRANGSLLWRRLCRAVTQRRGLVRPWVSHIFGTFLETMVCSRCFEKKRPL